MQFAGRSNCGWQLTEFTDNFNCSLPWTIKKALAGSDKNCYWVWQVAQIHLNRNDQVGMINDLNAWKVKTTGFSYIGMFFIILISQGEIWNFQNAIFIGLSLSVFSEWWSRNSAHFPFEVFPSSLSSLNGTFTITAFLLPTVNRQTCLAWN